MIKIRCANEKDSSTILKWRNDPLTREMFLNSEPVDEDSHFEWFTSTINDLKQCLLVCENNNNEAIAVIRFDANETEAEVSINLSPQHRNQGLAVPCLTEAIEFFKSHYPSIRSIIAEIKFQNKASKKTFIRAGFELAEQRSCTWIFKYNYEEKGS